MPTERCWVWVSVFCAVVLFLPTRAWGIGEPEDGSESVLAGVTLRHVPPLDCAPYSTLSVAVSAEPAPTESLSVTLWFRQFGDEEGFLSRPMDQVKSDLFSTSIPARVVGQMGVEYYIEARMGMGVFRAGSAEAPFRVATAYAFGGDVPEELPGDDYLRSLEPPGDAVAAASIERDEERGSSSLGVQLIVLVILGAIVYLVYQRITP